MYSRTKTWQTPVIDSIENNGFENIITLGFPCIDFRMKLIGYGWKNNVSDKNLSVLYPGRYEIFFRKIGAISWDHVSTIESTRADYSDDYVYEDTFFSLGPVNEDLYQIKVIASSGPVFGTWGGILEGISSGENFFYDLMIRGGQAIGKTPTEQLSISKRVTMGFDLLNINVYKNISLEEYVDGNNVGDINLSVATIFSLSEMSSPIFVQKIEVYDSLSIVENKSLILPILFLQNFDSFWLSEALNGSDPTIISFQLDHQYITEALSVSLLVNFSGYDSISLVENFMNQFTLWHFNLYETVNITESIVAYYGINTNNFDSISVIENTAQLLDHLEFSLAQAISLSEFSFLSSNLFLDIFSEVSLEEYFDSLKGDIVVIDAMEYSSDALAQAAYGGSGYGNTGGTITTDGLYKIHTFTSSGNFVSIASGSVATLLVGGGAGGGGGVTGSRFPAGGGGGNVVSNESSVSVGTYSVVVGLGGANGGTSTGTTGGTSSFNGASAIGGYGGYNAGTYAKGGNSGSGYTGGNGVNMTYGAGGGGAGAGGAGGAGSGISTGGNGGVGVANSITGVSTYYGGGGGGTGNSTTGTGGAGAVGQGGSGSTNGVNGVVIIKCLESDFYALKAFSEPTIKTVGTYSLKGTALITSSLNKTLIRTISSPIDLSGKTRINFDIRSSRTGSNIKVGVRDSGGVITEATVNILSANTFQTAMIDLSGVSDANKNAIDQIIITIINADAANTFYLDNFTSSI